MPPKSVSEAVQTRCRQKANYYLQLIAATGSYYAQRASMNTITHADSGVATTNLGNAREAISSITTEMLKDIEATANALQVANDNLGAAFRTAGTKSIVDLLNICEGPTLAETLDSEASEVWALLKLVFSPTSYRYLPWKKDNHFQAPGKRLAKDRIVDDYMIVEQAATLQCFDYGRTARLFHSRVHGIRIVFQLTENKRTLVVTGTCSFPPWETIESPLLKNMRNEILANDTTGYAPEFCQLLTVKDCLVYNCEELKHQLESAISVGEQVRKQQIGVIGNDFLSTDLYGKRRQLMALLTLSSKPDMLCLAQLLFDLLSSDSASSGGGSINDQALIHGSLPWSARRMVRKVLSLQSNENDSHGESKIPLEQRITLMKVPQWVKDKAQSKLREVRSKSDDTGAKARQYLEGLVRIPFGDIREEPCLKLLETAHSHVKQVGKLLNVEEPLNYEQAEAVLTERAAEEVAVLGSKLKRKTRDGLTDIAKELNLENPQGKNEGKGQLLERVQNAIIHHDTVGTAPAVDAETQTFPSLSPDIALAMRSFNAAKRGKEMAKDAASLVMDKLDAATHGHHEAKRALARVVGQWMSGEQSGYCFGFEGPPGVGKTSLAKRGLAKCLEDEDGSPRPFCFIALGGATNGSYLDGHSYTYVGSTWGRIVDCLMKSQCMNPIIYIDELDKVSRTEHGKEIIGILTHITDSTQNDNFNDKYFTGVPIDLSRVLFVFSYNDPSAIDRILLDRIHRIKFKPLSLSDKVTISEKFVIPDLKENHKLGFVPEIPPHTIQHIASCYSFEAGMRRLSEYLSTCVGEINLRAMEGKEYPRVLEPCDIDELLTEASKMLHPALPEPNSIGIVAGLWANSVGRGGMLPIEATWSFGSNFLEPKVTGLPGDTMRESVSVAINLAWSTLDQDDREQIEQEQESCGQKAIHVHFPDGATPKDGPSAGIATFLAITSLMKKMPVKNDWAVTGEVSLQGRAMEIGGVDLKITGGYESGCRNFIVPKRNSREVEAFYRNNASWHGINDITIHQVETVSEAADLIFV
jgi:ATP-dependent Lon protease